MQYFPDFLVGIRLALRAKFLWLAGCSFVMVAVAAMLASLFSGRQPATVALDIGLSVIRLVLPLVLVLVTQELLSREFERRYFLTSLTYPRPRHNLLLGRSLAVCVLVLLVLLVAALLLAAVVTLVGQGYAQGTPVSLDYRYCVVIGFIALDALLLAAVAAFLAVVASTPSFVLIGTFGFMLIARSYAAIVALLTRNSYVVTDAESYRAGVGALGYLLPDLGALDVRGLALYRRMEFLPSDWPWLLLSCLLYTIALLALAVWALGRKRFA